MTKKSFMILLPTQSTILTDDLIAVNDMIPAESRNRRCFYLAEYKERGLLALGKESIPK